MFCFAQVKNIKSLVESMKEDIKICISFIQCPSLLKENVLKLYKSYIQEADVRLLHTHTINTVYAHIHTSSLYLLYTWLSEMAALGESRSEDCGRERSHHAEGTTADDGGHSREETGCGCQHSTSTKLHPFEGMINRDQSFCLMYCTDISIYSTH